MALAKSEQLFDNKCDQFPVVPPNSLLPNWVKIMALVVTMTGGTGVIMWLGEMITDRGVGNGMSVLIFTSIAARLPAEGWSVKVGKGWWIFSFIIAIGLIVITAVVFIEQAQRRVPVQYAKRMVGRRMYGGTSTYIPLKVNQAGVIPVIFASSLLYLPQLLANVWSSNVGFSKFVNRYLATGDHPLYLLMYFSLIVFFTYFYVAITFNPIEVSDNMNKYGGFVPGIRPGRATAEYLDYILSRITTFGALYLGCVAVLPYLLFSVTGGA